MHREAEIIDESTEKELLEKAKKEIAWNGAWETAKALGKEGVR